MSRRRGYRYLISINPDYSVVTRVLRPVDLARRERVRRHIQRVKRRAAKRWTA